MTEQTIAHKQKQLTKQVAAFAKPETKNSLIQLLNTFIPFFGLWFLAYFSLNVSYLLTLALTVIAAGFLTRILSSSMTVAINHFSNKSAITIFSVF